MGKNLYDYQFKERQVFKKIDGFGDTGNLSGIS